MMYDEARAQSTELKKRQVSGGGKEHVYRFHVAIF